MEDMTLFIFGLMVGVVGMAFVVLLMSIRSQFTEIKWHNARWDDPSEYKTNGGIEVLVRLSSGRIATTTYFPDIQSYSLYKGYCIDAEITHWAYAVEVGNTIPKHITPTFNDHHDAI